MFAALDRRPFFRRLGSFRFRPSGLARAALFALPLAFAAGPAAAQPFVLLGSASEPDVDSQWMLGGGYEIEFLAVPVSVGFMAQTGPGFTSAGLAGEDEESSGRTYPARGYVFAKGGVLPTPGFRVYVGGGAGLAARLGGGADSSPRTSGVGLLGLQVGRIRLETQLQRDFGEDPLTRWVSALGISF